LSTPVDPFKREFGFFVLDGPRIDLGLANGGCTHVRWLRGIPRARFADTISTGVEDLSGARQVARGRDGTDEHNPSRG
jgi:hypothetical protein